MAKDVFVDPEAVAPAAQTAGVADAGTQNLHFASSGRWLQVPVREGITTFTSRWLPGDERINPDEWSRLTDEVRATWPLHQHPGAPERRS